MVNTVSTLGVGFVWTEALATEAPGSEASAIQSWGMTKRANTLPLKPLPFSPAGVKVVLAAGARTVLTVLSEEALPPDDATEVAIESE
jgi:hypothetical protein